MEYLRETIDSGSLAGIFNLPASLRNRNVEVIILPIDVKKEEKQGRKSLKGSLHQYANPELIPLEKDAWARAEEEKQASQA
jgi:hypothetical protein